jgi:DNA-binding PadR family transcriptional regulator
MPQPSALTPLAVMVLGLLREGDMHPYEMMRLLRARRDDRLVTIQNGTFYHTVARLQRAGLVDEIGIDRDGNRPERTTYRLTSAGDGAVEEWIRGELGRIDRPGPFRVALAEAHNLPLDEVLALLDGRRMLLAAALAELRRGLTEASARGAEEQYLIEARREEALLEAEQKWQDGLLARLRDRSIPWGPAEAHSQPWEEKSRT